MNIKTKLIGLVMLASILIGCSGYTIDQLAADAYDAAAFGTTAALIEAKDPAAVRAKITKVRDGLALLEAQPDPITLDSITKVLQQLPVEELQGKRALLYITGGRIILRRAGKEVEMGNISTLRPVVTSLKEGFTFGLG